MALPVNSQFGMKKETTWGTAVTVDKFLEYESETLSLSRGYFDGVGLRADTTFGPSSRTKALRRGVNGDVAFAVPTKLFGAVLDQMVTGTITPVQQAATIAYLSTFNVGLGAAPTKSATLQVNKPTSQSADTAFTYPGAVLGSTAFSAGVGGVLMCTTSWTAKDETTPSTTPAGAALASASYASGSDVWADTEITLTINGGAAAAVTGVNFTWAQPLATDRGFLDGSSTFAQPVSNGRATVTGSLTAEWYDATYYNLFRSGAFASLVMTAAGSTAIATTYFPTFKATMSAVQIRGTSPTVSGGDLISTDVPFVAKYDGTNAPLKIEYTSTDSVAW